MVPPVLVIVFPAVNQVSASLTDYYPECEGGRWWTWRNITTKNKLYLVCKHSLADSRQIMVVVTLVTSKTTAPMAPCYFIWVKTCCAFTKPENIENRLLACRDFFCRLFRGAVWKIFGLKHEQIYKYLQNVSTSWHLCIMFLGNWLKLAC